MGALENLGATVPFGKKYLQSRTSDVPQIKVKRQRTSFLPKVDQHTIYCAPNNSYLDEELFISEYMLVHSRGERLIRALSYGPCHGTIRFAFWASLSINSPPEAAKKEHPSRTLCVFFEDSIQCYCETGVNYPVHLPFPPEKAWPLGNHVLIQSERVNTKGGTFSKFYTLTHPLEGVKPITESYTQKSGLHPLSIEALLGRGVFELVHVPQPESELPFLVFFHAEKQKYSIWKWSFKSSDLFKKPKLFKATPKNSRLLFDPDDIEYPPEPQLSLELIWEQETSSGISLRTFFLKHQKETLLCLVFKSGKMNCYRFNEGVRTSTEIFSTEALDAIPVSSFRETSQEVLYLSLEGNFLLWPGLGLEPVPIHSNPACTFNSFNHPSGMRFSAKCKQDNSWYKFSFSCYVNNKLVLDCIDAMSLFLPKEVLYTLKVRMMLDSSPVWHRFVACFLSLLIDPIASTAEVQSQPFGFHLLANQYSHLIGDSEAHNSEFDEFIQSAIRNPPSDVRSRVVLPEIIQVLHILLQEYMVLELHSQECYLLAQLLGTLTQAKGWDSFNEYYKTFFEFSPSEMNRMHFAPLSINRPLNEPFCIFRHLSTGAPLSLDALVNGLGVLRSDSAEEIVSSIFPGLLTLSGKPVVSVERFIPSLQIYLRDSYSLEAGEGLQANMSYENFTRESSASPPLDISGLVDEKGLATNSQSCYSESSQEELFADHRLAEVRDLLSPSTPETFVFPDMNDLSTKSKAEITICHDRYLRALVTARMLGTSLLTFRTDTNIVIKPTSWAIFQGQFVLSGFNSEGLKYTVNKESPVWVLFQQGIITALQISCDAPSCILPSSSVDLPQLGGYLFGLGLQGRLRGLANVNFYMAMASNNAYLISGVLLGLAASNFASHSPSLSALIEVNLPANSPQIHDVKSMSALLSLALVNFRSNDSRLMHRALDHIDVPLIRAGIKEKASLASATILTAGISLGFLGFGMGPVIESNIISRLHELFVARSGYALQLGLAMLFFNTNSKESLKLLESARISSRGNPLAQMVNHLCQCLVRWSHSPILTQESVSGTSSHFGAKSAAEVFALGLLYMGTCNADTLASIQGISDGFQKLACETEDPFRCAVYNSFLTMSHVAMSLVMAGSGDLGVLQRLRGFQRRREASVDFGHLSANSFALGLLMVGEGRFRVLKEKPGSVALMLLAVFPLFPQAPEDLDPFPQIFRSFWVLTLEPKRSLSTEIIASNLVQDQSSGSYVPRGLSDVLKKVPLSSFVDLPPLDSSKRMPLTCFSFKQLVPQYTDKNAIKMASFLMLHLYSSISKRMPFSLIAKIVEEYCRWEAHLESTSSQGVANLKPGLKAFLAFQIIPSILRLRKNGTSLQ